MGLGRSIDSGVLSTESPVANSSGISPSAIRISTSIPAQPSPAQVKIANHRTAIVSGTVIAHAAHWQYLTRVRRIDLYVASSRRFLAAAGLGWGLVYLGVLSTITIAERDVHRYSDYLLRGKI